MKPNPIASLQRASRGEEKLWVVWWQWGIPLALLANALTLMAEAAREADRFAAGDALDVFKLLLFLAWLRLAWRCSNNTARPHWGALARLALFLGFGLAALTI